MFFRYPQVKEAGSSPVVSPSSSPSAVSLSLTCVRTVQDQHRPALLITDCSERKTPPDDQNGTFCRTVLTALTQKGGHVLVPVDTSARVLELLYVLNQFWASHNLTFPIVLLARTALSTLMKARAQLEFMIDKVQNVRPCCSQSHTVACSVAWLRACPLLSS
jgi:hypothetical protein